MAVPTLACSQQDVLQSQGYSCKSEVLRTNSVVLDSRHRKDQLYLNRQSSYRKTHLYEITAVCTNNITVGTTQHHYLEMGLSIVQFTNIGAEREDR